MIEKLILDEKALESMGLSSKTYYIIEYDLYDDRCKIPANNTPETKKRLQKRNKLAKSFRNKLIFLLKFKLNATKHLESCWVIEENRLDLAIDALEGLKEEMKAKGFSDIDKRLRVIPILTTVEGFQHYEDKKVEFLLNFAMEHLAYIDKGKKAQRMSKSTLWRCKQAYSIVEALKDELKGNQRFNEILDTNEMLGEAIGDIESIIEEQKRKEAQKSKDSD